jgi:aspartyl protease family protein
MLLDVLKIASRPAFLAAIVSLVAVKGIDSMHLGEAQPPSNTASAMTRPAPAPATGGGYMILEGNQAGHFQTDVQVEGVSLKMLVDTGATAVTLSAEDADRAGIHPFPSDYNVAVNTANGVTQVARVELHQVSVGPITVRDVPALVMQPGASSVSLLGMTFLQRLSSFQVADNRLVLKP